MKDFTGRADTLLAGFEDGPAQIRSIARADAASSSAFPAKIATAIVQNRK